MTLIDLTQAVAHGTVTYPGLPAVSITDHVSREASKERYAAGTTFQIGRVEMVANTSTYLDAPSHRYADGLDIAELPLEQMADLEGFAAAHHASGARVHDRVTRSAAVPAAAIGRLARSPETVAGRGRPPTAGGTPALHHSSESRRPRWRRSLSFAASASARS